MANLLEPIESDLPVPYAFLFLVYLDAIYDDPSLVVIYLSW